MRRRFFGIAVLLASLTPATAIGGDFFDLVFITDVTALPPSIAATTSSDVDSAFVAAAASIGVTIPAGFALDETLLSGVDDSVRALRFILHLDVDGFVVPTPDVNFMIVEVRGHTGIGGVPIYTLSTQIDAPSASPVPGETRTLHVTVLGTGPTLFDALSVVIGDLVDTGPMGGFVQHLDVPAVTPVPLLGPAGQLILAFSLIGAAVITIRLRSSTRSAGIP